MQAGGEEGDGDGEGGLLGLGGALGHFCGRDGNVRRDAVEFGLLLDGVLGERAVGRVDGDGLHIIARGLGQPVSHNGARYAGRKGLTRPRKQGMAAEKG